MYDIWIMACAVRSLGGWRFLGASADLIPEHRSAASASCMPLHGAAFAPTAFKVRSPSVNSSVLGNRNRNLKKRNLFVAHPGKPLRPKASKAPRASLVYSWPSGHGPADFHGPSEPAL